MAYFAPVYMTCKTLLPRPFTLKAAGLRGPDYLLGQQLPARPLESCTIVFRGDEEQVSASVALALNAMEAHANLLTMSSELGSESSECILIADTRQHPSAIQVSRSIHSSTGRCSLECHGSSGSTAEALRRPSPEG